MKKALLLLVLFISAITVSAQKPEDFTGSLLWKISGNGLEHDSYVFGTYHYKGVELLDSVPGLREAIEATAQTAAEMTATELASAQFKMMPYMMMPQDKGYKDILNKEEYTRLDNALKGALGAGLEQFGMLTPAMISMSMVVFIHIQENPGFDMTALEGIDGYLLRITTENGKKEIGLETADDQIKMLFDSGDTMEEQIESLICALDNFDFSVQSYRNLTEDYMKGDLYKIYMDGFHNINNPCLHYVKEEHKDAMLKDRNDKWMEQLPIIMAEAPTLVAVGAGHLAGEEGVLYQLSQLGYKVEPVK